MKMSVLHKDSVHTSQETLSSSVMQNQSVNAV